MSPHATIHWMGFRKDASRGSVWGWFTQTGKRAEPIPTYGNPNNVVQPKCYVFWGSIGKKLHIEEMELTFAFLETVKDKKKNYRQVDSVKITSRWGKVFDEEFSMYLLMLVMKG